MLKEREKVRDEYIYFCTERRKYGIDIQTYIYDVCVTSIPIRVGTRVIRVKPDISREEMWKKIQETRDEEEISIYNSSKDITVDDIIKLGSGRYKPETRPKRYFCDTDITALVSSFPPYFSKTIGLALRHYPSTLLQVMKWAEKRDKLIRAAMTEGRVLIESIDYCFTQILIFVPPGKCHRCVLKKDSLVVAPVARMPSGCYVGISGDDRELKQRLLDAITDRDTIEII